MSLRVSPVSRNLNAKVVLFGLEFDDLLVLVLLGVAGMLIGQTFFSDTYVFFLPMNFALLFGVIIVGVPGLSILKYGKPRGYTTSLYKWYTTPTEYSCLEPDRKITCSYIENEDDDA